MFTLVKTLEYACKNNLQKDVLSLIKKYDRTLFPDALEVDNFISELSNELIACNKRNPRCTPLNIDKWVTYTDITFRIESVIQVTFYKIQKKYKS